MASPAAKKILIEDFGYQPVDIESKSGYSRAVKETIVKLEKSHPLLALRCCSFSLSSSR